MSRLKVAIAGIWLLAVACLLSLPAGLWWLGTERGTVWLASFVEASTAGRLSIAEVRGGLWSRVTLEGLRLLVGGDELRIEQAALTLDFTGLLAGTLAIDDLVIDAASYRRGASEGPSGDGGWSLPLRIAIRRSSLGRLTLVTGDRTLYFDATRAVGELQGDTLLVERIETTTAGIALLGQGQISFAQPMRLAVEVDWDWAFQGEKLSGRAGLEGEWPRLSLHHELRSPFEVTADGEITLEDAPRFALDLRWVDLGWPAWEEVASSPSGQMRLDGTLASFEFSGSGDLLLQGEPLTFGVVGATAGPHLSLRPLVLEHPGGVVSASGDVSLDTREWALQLAGRALDPGVRFPDWPGRLQANGSLQGGLLPQLQWRLDSVTLEGQLRERPIAASGNLAYEAPGVWRLGAVRVQSGPNRLELDGAIEAQQLVGLQFAADAPDLSVLWPPLAGSLSGRGSLSGPLSSPSAEGALEARGVELGEYAVARLGLAGRGGLSVDAPLQLDVELLGLRRGSFNAGELSAELVGTTGRHQASFVLRAEQLTAALRAHGGIDAATWQGFLDDATVTPAALGDWVLQAPAALTLGRGRADLGQLCLGQASARLCALAQLLGQPDDRIELSARGFDLRVLQPLLPPELAAEGLYEASFSMSQFGSEPRGSLSLRGAETRLALQLAGRDPFERRLTAVSFSALLADSELELEGEVLGADGATASLNGRVTDLAEPDSALRGRLDVSWPDLGFLALLSPDFGEVGGALDIGLTAAGTLDAPQLQGRARVDGGRITVPEWGLVVDAIEASASSIDGTALEFVATGRVGDGQVDVRGSTELDPRAGWPTRLNLRGESIQAVQRPDAEVFVSPDIDLELQLPDVYASGTVHIPRARIVLAELPAQAIAPSADAVVHGIEQPDIARPLRLHSDLRFTLGEDVSYSGLGLTAGVTGEIQLAHEPGEVPIASGTVGLAGEYDAYGQPLLLDRGQLLFNGPWDDPALDVRAVRRIEENMAGEEITVGVQLSGTLKRPQTRMFSVPAMSEADALAYLLFGLPLTGTEQQQTATLQGAALSMGLQQALSVQRIGRSLGLDELTVQTTDTDAGALMAGKYLSPRVYMRYSYGLFSRIGGLLLRFSVSDRLSVETRTGDQQSVDLLYTVEKD